MTPEFMDSMSWEMAEVYGAITDQILINLAHYFPYYKPGQPVPMSTFEYQANLLAQMGQVNRETIRIIRNGLGGADGALKGVLEQAIIDAVSKAQPELLEAVKKGILSPICKPIVAPSQARAFQLYYQQACDKLNLVNTVMLESTQSAYQQCISDVVSEINLADSMNRLQIAVDTAAGETITGVESWNRALQHATQRMTETGIVGFIDHAGHRWSAEAYVAMDIRTTVANTARAAVWDTNQDFGNDLYSVSYHNGARPLCYPYQNKVVSRTDAARVVQDLDGNDIEVIAQSSTSYGQPAGLFGINCKHYPTPFIPGVSLIRGEPQDPATNERVYEESQQQRSLERKIREEKRDLDMMRAQGAPPEAIRAQRAKIRETDDEIDAFCDQTGRARRQNREAVYTKRDFPDADKYDVSAFEHKQKDIIDEWFKNGGNDPPPAPGGARIDPNDNPPPAPAQIPIAPVDRTTINPEVATFTPAKTIEEAEDFAKTYCDTSAWGSPGISFKGVSLETANEVNKQLSEFYRTFNVEKFGGVVAPAGNTKLGMRIKNATAAYGTYNKSVLLNRNSLKTPNLVLKKCAEEKALVTKYIENPSYFKISTATAKKVLDLSVTSGRGTVPDNLYDVINHELGHALQKGLQNAPNYDIIKANWETFGVKISGYAAYNFDEYIAESFCSWRKGENIVDPEIIKAFVGLMR